MTASHLIHELAALALDAGQMVADAWSVETRAKAHWPPAGDRETAIDRHHSDRFAIDSAVVEFLVTAVSPRV